MKSRLQVLSISSMFPNPRMPVHARFVKNRLDALSRRVDLTVVSPIPWFPGERLINKYRNRNQIPSASNENPYPVFFPRFLSFPAILKPLDGIFMSYSIKSWMSKHCRPDDVGIIDCHLAYPDGFAGALLAKMWNKPFVVTIRGHDINDLNRYPVRIRQVLFSLRRCNRFFGVSQALVDGAIRLGAPSNKGYCSSNGVDTEHFYPSYRKEACEMLGLDPECRHMLSVSHIVKRKGIDILLRAFALLRKRGYSMLRYVIVGEGGEEGDYTSELKKLADDLQISPCVTWSGAVENKNLHWYYSAADVSCLASEKEGWPNVILESLACGTPVIAHATWGVPEIIPNERIGTLVQNRTPEAFAEAIARALEMTWDSEAIVRYAKEHSWEKTAGELFRHFTEIVDMQQGKDTKLPS